MKKLTLKSVLLCTSLFLLPLISAKSATILWDTDILPDWSTSDGLQGVRVQVASGQALYIGSGPDASNGQIISSPTLRLTDATSPSAPTLSVLAADTDTTWLFDLTALGIPPENRLMTSFSMWMLRDDVRRGVNVVLQTSVDGITWNTGWSAVQYDGVLYEAGTYNNLTYVFGEGEAQNFNYLRVVDQKFGAYNPIWTEWDATFVTVPEPQSAVLLVLAASAGIVVYKMRKNRAPSPLLS